LSALETITNLADVRQAQPEEFQNDTLADEKSHRHQKKLDKNRGGS
jgi:hypothetical protein